jgi:hypothetical protein
VCGNSVTGAFDRPLWKDLNIPTGRNDYSLSFRLL